MWDETESTRFQKKKKSCENNLILFQDQQCWSAPPKAHILGFQNSIVERNISNISIRPLQFINAHVDSLDAAEDYYDLKVLFIIQPIVPNEYTVSSYHSQGKKNIQGKMFLFSSFFFFLPLVAYSSLLPSTKEDSLASNRTGLLVVGGHKPEYGISKDAIWFYHTHTGICLELMSYGPQTWTLVPFRPWRDPCTTKLFQLSKLENPTLLCYRCACVVFV